MPDFFSHLLSVPAFSKPKMASTSSTCFSEKHGGRNRRRFTTLEVIEMLQTEGSDVEESDDDSESDVMGEENYFDDLDESVADAGASDVEEDEEGGREREGDASNTGEALEGAVRDDPEVSGEAGAVRGDREVSGFMIYSCTYCLLT